MFKGGKMPYPGIPPSKTMESCVNDLMADPKMKGKYKDPKERKSHAIAICHDSIMGSKKSADTKVMADKSDEESEKGKDMKPIVINFYGDYWKEKIAQNDIKEDVKKENGKEVTKEVDKKEVKKQEEPKAETPKVEEIKEPVVPEVKPVEVEVKPEGEVKAEVKVEEEKKEVPQPEVKEEVKEEVKPEEKTPAEPEVVADEEVKVDSTADLIKNVIAKIDILMAKKEDKKMEKADAAPAEGAAPEKEEAPKGGEGESPKEEAKEDASPEGAEKVVKDESLVKVNDSLGKLTGQIEKFDSKFVSLEDRLAKLEAQPVPSKVVSAVAVSKADVNPSFSSENKEELTKIDKELANLEEMKKSDLGTYQRDEKWRVAWKLIERKQAILSEAK